MPLVLSYYHLPLSDSMTYVTLAASGHWLGTRTVASGTAKQTVKLFWSQSMAPRTTGHCLSVGTNPPSPCFGVRNPLPKFV